MTKTKRTEKEIDEIVVAQGDDDSSWEPEIRVRPSRFWRISPTRIELAAKFFVLSALNRLGGDAIWAWSEHKDVDIALISESGRTITIDVRAVTGSTRWRVEEIPSRENHFVVFVCFVNDVADPHIAPEVYVLASSALRNALVHTHASEVELSELGAKLNARDAWHQLTTPQPAG